MGKIISIDEINRAVMEVKDDLVFELCKVFDHESYFCLLYTAQRNQLRLSCGRTAVRPGYSASRISETPFRCV